MNQIHNPVIPYNGPIPGGMFPGRIIRIQGIIPVSSHKFALNLLCGALGDIALHVSPDFSSGHIIRNSVQNRSWGHEEKHGGLPLTKGHPFSMIVLCEPHQYKIALIDRHFAEFKHRLPLNSVTNVGIDGEVCITQISFEGSSGVGTHPVGFAPPAPSAPFTSYSGGAPYPPAGVPTSAYPSQAGHVPHPAGHAPYPAPPTQQPGHAAYPQQSGLAPHGAYPQQPGHAPHSAYPTQAYSAYPQQPGYPVHGSPHSQPHTGYPHSPTGHKKTGLLDKAGMAVAGALGASTLMGAGGHKYNKLGVLGGGLGAATLAGAAMTGHLSPKKALKKQKKAHKKALKYGLPLAGAGIGAYALHKGMHKLGHHHHHRHSSSSSSSSSSSNSS